MPGPDEPVGGAAAERETDEAEVTVFEDATETADEEAPTGLTLGAEEAGDIAKQAEEFPTNNEGRAADPLEVN